MATPDPSNVAPWYLRNLNQALALDSVTGNVYIRTDAQIGTLTIAGNVNIPGNINANVYQLGNVDISGNALPVTGNITVAQGTSPWIISGNVQVSNVATDLTIADSTYEMNVARGLITGQYAEMKNGYANGISQNTEVTVWNETTLYPWASWTVAQKLYIASTSAADTGQVLRIEGLNASYNKITEDVTTSGTSAIATTQNFLRLNRGYLISGNSNIGTITERLVNGSGTIVGSMAPSFSRNKGGFFTVPAGYTAYILYGDATQFRGGAGNIGGIVKMFTRTGAGPFLLQFIAEVVNGQYRNNFTVPLAVPERTDIDVRIVADGNGTQATCNWQMILIPN